MCMKINTKLLKRLVLTSCILGGIITIFSGLLTNIPPGLLGVAYWGYPLPWIKQVVYPGAPKVIIWHFFVLDWLIWMGLSLAVLYGIKIYLKA